MRVELTLPADILDIIQTKADAAGQSRKKYLESLITRDAMTNPQPAIGQYLRTNDGYIYNYEGQTLQTSTDTNIIDNFQYQFFGDAGSIEDSLTF